jgi:DNA-binding SARP family transcriptional activator
MFSVKLNSNVWKKNQLQAVMPRYSSASAIVNNRLYIFGGRGSKTGKQEVNPQYKYDMYSVDLISGETKLLWEVQSDAYYLPCGNMIYNPSDSCFYVLTNIENGTLIRITTCNSSIEKVSGGINQSITADFFFYNVFFSQGQQKLYSLFCSNRKQGTSVLSLYEMNFPPLPQSEISWNPNIQKGNPQLFIVAGIIILIALGIIAYLFFVSKRKNIRLEKPAIAANEEKNMLAGDTETSPDHGKTLEPVKIYDRTKRCISLLGGFNVVDKEGNNITSNFTPILKNLLLLILLYSEIEEKGIKDNKIDNLLWGDKDNKAARNNRNVSLTRLKLLLENIGNISLLNNSGFWRIDFDKDVFCDYNTALQYIKRYKTGNIDKNDLAKLLELLMYGQLLPYTPSTWIDKFKSDYSNDAIDILYNLLLSSDWTNNERLVVQIVDAIFLFDSLNEEALGIKCSILYNSGKKGLAKSTYDIFAKEYKTMLGENYRYSLLQVLETAQILNVRK